MDSKRMDEIAEKVNWFSDFDPGMQATIAKDIVLMDVGDLLNEIHRLQDVEEAVKSLAEEKREQAMNYHSEASDYFHHMDWEGGAGLMVKYTRLVDQAAEIERALGG